MGPFRGPVANRIDRIGENDGKRRGLAPSVFGLYYISAYLSGRNVRETNCGIRNA